MANVLYVKDKIGGLGETNFQFKVYASGPWEFVKMSQIVDVYGQQMASETV